MQSVPCEFVYRGIDARDRDRLCKLSREVQNKIKGLRVPQPSLPVQPTPPKPAQATVPLNAGLREQTNQQELREQTSQRDRELQAYRLLPSYLESVKDKIQQITQGIDTSQSVPVEETANATARQSVLLATPPVAPTQTPSTPPSPSLPTATPQIPTRMSGPPIPTNMVELARSMAELIGVQNMDQNRQFELPEGDQLRRLLKVVVKAEDMDETIKDRIKNTLSRGLLTAQDYYELYKWIYDRLPVEQQETLPAPTWERGQFQPRRKEALQQTIPPSVVVQPSPVSQESVQPTVQATVQPSTPNPFVDTREEGSFNPFVETLPAPGAIPEEDPNVALINNYEDALTLLNSAEMSPTGVLDFFKVNNSRFANNPLLRRIVEETGRQWEGFQALLRSENTPAMENSARQYLMTLLRRLEDERAQLWDAMKIVLRNYLGNEELRNKVCGLLLAEFVDVIPDALFLQLQRGVCPADVLGYMERTQSVNQQPTVQ